MNKVYREKKVLAILSLVTSSLAFVAFGISLMFGAVLFEIGNSAFGFVDFGDNGLLVLLWIFVVMFVLAILLLFIVTLAIGIIGGVLPITFDILSLMHNDLKSVKRLRLSNIIKSILYLVCLTRAGFLFTDDFNTGVLVILFVVALIAGLSVFIVYRTNKLCNILEENNDNGQAQR